MDGKQNKNLDSKMQKQIPFVEQVICVVGFGATGVSFLSQILKAIEAKGSDRKVKIVIFDGDDRPGRGCGRC